MSRRLMNSLLILIDSSGKLAIQLHLGVRLRSGVLNFIASSGIPYFSSWRIMICIKEETYRGDLGFYITSRGNSGGSWHSSFFFSSNPTSFRLRKLEMANAPACLIWEIVKRNNAFRVKQFGNGNSRIEFSKEPNNLYNLNSFKYSGLAQAKTVTIQPEGTDLSVVLATTKTKKQNKPSSSLHRSVMRKDFQRMAKAVKNQVCDNKYRPDLKNAALARLSSVYRGLQVKKSGPKKRNRQATRK